jgi:hypothetical protein
MKVIDQFANISGEIQESPSRVEIGETEARPIGRDHPNIHFETNLVHRASFQPRTRPTVKVDDWKTPCASILRKAELPAIAQPHLLIDSVTHGNATKHIIRLLQDPDCAPEY